MKQTNTQELDYKTIYLKWIRENIDQKIVGQGIVRMSFPFLDVNNDYAELYIKRLEDGNYSITDDGYTISNLELEGFGIEKGSRRENILISIINSFGVDIDNAGGLYVNCSLSELAQKKHMLIQCMMKVSDMFYLSKHNIKSLFYEDVKKYLDENDVRYIENVDFVGKSKLSNKYDFVVPKGKNSPERFIKVINNMSITQAKNIIFNWNDTIDVRNEEADLYAFICDDKRRIPDNAIEALNQYRIVPVLWSERNDYVNKLA